MRNAREALLQKTSITPIYKIIEEAKLGPWIRYYEKVRLWFKEISDINEDEKHKQREKDALDNLEVIEKEIQEKGETFTRRSLIRKAGLKHMNLKNFPSVALKIDQIITNHGHLKRPPPGRKNEDDLLQEVQRKRDELAKLGYKVTQIKVAKGVGMTPKGLGKYPKVRAFLDEIARVNKKSGMQNGQERNEDRC